MTAIGVTGAVALAGSAFALEGTADDSSETQRLPDDAVVFDMWRVDGGLGEGSLGVRPEAIVPAALRAGVERIFPGSVWHTRREATFAGRVDRQPGVRRGVIRLTPDASLVVADEATMDLYDLPDVDRDALADTGAVLLQDWYSDRDPGVEPAAMAKVRLLATDGAIELTAARRDYLRTPEADDRGEVRYYDSNAIRGPDVLMVTEALAVRKGLDVVTRGGFLRTDGPVTLDQQERLERLSGDQFSSHELSGTYRDVPPSESSTWNLDWEHVRRDLSVPVQGAIAAFATLLVLIVVAIGLSLAATESRDERDVLVAVGAKPSTMRRMAGVKAVVLTLTGGLLAVPTGIVPTWAVMRAADMSFVTPWLQLGLLLVAVPLVVGLAAWGSSSVAQRVRPVRMSNLAVD